MSHKEGFELNRFYSKIFKRYDLINRIFTFGMDKSWRRIAARECIETNPLAVLDLCCGTGDLVLELAKQKANPGGLYGYDFNSNMLEMAQYKAQQRDIVGIEFVQGDAASLPFESEKFDCITIGFGFRNLTFDNPNREQHIREMHRVLKTGGKLIILESSVPANSFIRFFYFLYLYAFLIPIGALISGNPKAYWYLAHSSARFFKPVQVGELLSNYGFENMKVRSFFFGSANLIMATRG